MPESASPYDVALAQLPRFYSFKDVLAEVFGGDEDRFIDAWCDGSLPRATRDAVLDTMPPRLIEVYLLRRIVRLLQPPAEPSQC